MAFSNGPTVVTNGLVLSLDAADRNSYPGSGTTWTDLSGNGNNGTLNNGPTFSSANGGSIVFDGVDDFVNVPNSSTIQVDSFTLEGWVYPLSNANPPSDSVGYHIMRKDSSFILTHHWNSTQKVGLWMQRSTTSWEATFSSTPVPINQWSYIVATYDNITARVYNNAIQVASTSRVGTTRVTSNPILINGAVSNSIPQNYNLSGVKIYNRALSAAEVQQNYLSTKSRFGL